MNEQEMQFPSAEPRPVTRGARERGMAVLITGLMLTLTLGTVGLAIDGGVAFVVKGRLMAAVDSAALAAGRSLNLGASVSEANTAATSTATRFFNANLPSTYMGINPTATTVNAVFTPITANGVPTGILQVDVTGAVTAPTYFMKIFNVPNVRISATGTATRRGLVMVLILDTSGSMGGRSSVGTIPTTVTSSSSSCDAMVFAANSFLQYFSPYDRIGIATFDTRAFLDYAPSTNYKATGSTGASFVLANKNCGGNTNTTPALQLAWQAIQNVNLPLALNSIVLFTDGVPNRVNGNFPLRTQKDTRSGPGPAYGISPPPTNDLLLHSDPRNPLTHNPGLAAPPTLPIPSTTNLNSVNNNSYGWFLNSRTGPFMRRWIQDANAPAGNYDTCRSNSWSVGCYQMPLPSLNATPSLMYGTTWQGSNYSYERSNQGAFDFPITGGTNRTNPPSGFPTSNAAFSAQTIAYLPETDPWGNSNRGFRDGRIFQVNQQCAPNGTTMPNGGSRCRNMGGEWSAYPSFGVGGNTWPSGPYQGFLRTDCSNTTIVAAMNSAVNAAFNIRANTTFNVRFDSVYLIGGDAIVDREFLQIIANAETIIPLIFEPAGTATYANPFYQTSQQRGLFRYTNNGAQLGGLFAEIASSLLRLSK
jgi:hypothetical protein